MSAAETTTCEPSALERALADLERVAALPDEWDGEDPDDPSPAPSADAVWRAGSPRARAPHMTPLHDRLRHAREAAGLSQSELARRAGWLPSAVCRLESGAHELRLSTLERLAEALDCELAIELVPRKPRAKRAV